MESYLQIARTAVLNSFADGQFVHVVLGNEACDLDSAVSALTYAFFLHKTRTAIPRPNTAVIPILNIKRHELYLHTDVNYFLNETGVPLSLLSFRDDLDLKALHAAQKLTLTLVDHNTLSREDSFLAYSVTEIIDHHAKLPRTMTQRCYITLEMVGSCCTLIAERFLNTDHSNLLDRQIALLLYGTILLDTICLNDAAKRVTAKDKMVAEKLHEFLSDVDRDALFKSLHKAKCDVSGLSVEELLRRDLKSTSNDTMKIAISTISSSLKEFIQRPNAEVDLERFAVANACQIVVLMGVQVNTDTVEVERQLAVYSAVQGYREQIVDLLEAVSTRGAKLCLQSWPSPYSTVVLYHQGNVAATRKVVLPLLHMFLHGDRSPSVSSDPSSTIKNGCRSLASNNINNGKSNGEDDQNMADYDPLAAESEDVVPLNNPIGNPVSSQLHMLGVGDPMSHAGSSQSSNQNSCPYTPQNSCTDGGLELDPYARQILPSFNSREMMEKIETKRGKLRGYDEGDGADNPYPFTPKNSFVDGSFEAYVKQAVPSFDSGDFLLKVNEKVAAAAAAASMDTPVTADEEMIGSITVEVPQVAAVASSDRNNHTRDSTAERDDPPTDSLDKPLPQKCPEAVSFSEQLDKSTEIMDTAETSASSDKTSPLPTDLETMNTTTTLTSIAATTNSNDVRDNQPTLKSEMTSQIATATTTLDSNATLSTADMDLDLAANYQTETVDFPDSPRQLKFLTQSTQGLSLEETVPEEEEEETEQPEDEDFRAVLSPSSDGVVKLKKERPNTLTTTGMKKRKIKVNADILNASEDKEDDQRSWSSLSNRSDGDILTPGDDMATPDDIDTPDDLDDSVTEVTDPIPEVSAAEERNEERRWRTCVIGGVQRKIDLKVIEPYKKVLSHGGYYGPKRSAIIVFSACYLPDHGRKDYDYVMDNLFLYVLTTLDQLVAEDYVLVYLHGALDRSHMPTFGWLKRCYQMIDRRLRKNLKGLYLVHPTFWLKTIVLMTKPFISTKFSRKLQFVNTLQELADLIPVDQMSIPDKVKQLEFELMIKEKKRQQRKKDKETTAATTTTEVQDSSSEDEINNSVEGACELNFRRIQAEHYAYGGGWF